MIAGAQMSNNCQIDLVEVVATNQVLYVTIATALVKLGDFSVTTATPHWVL
jgi:hypothetical protein